MHRLLLPNKCDARATAPLRQVYTRIRPRRQVFLQVAKRTITRSEKEIYCLCLNGLLDRKRGQTQKPKHEPKYVYELHCRFRTPPTTSLIEIGVVSPECGLGSNKSKIGFGL